MNFDFVELIRAVAALAITLGLVGLAGVALRKFGPDALSRLSHLRKDRRMQVIETLALDPTRRLVLFTLDGEERLLILGDGKLVEWGPKPVAAAPVSISPIQAAKGPVV
jgi:flagellar protein FliO/FliZ